MNLMKCFDCNMENENHIGWYADFTEEGKIMRCPECGEKEKQKRWKNHFGDKKMLSSIEEVDKQDRIKYAKDLREKGLSPWKFRQI